MIPRRGLVAAALALALVPLAPAHATGSTFLGKCGYDTISIQPATAQDEFTGVLFGTVVLYGSEHRNVVNATVTCELRVNGVVQASASQWGSGVVALADTVTFVARDVDEVTFCTVADFTSDDTPTESRCAGATQMQMPPQEWIDLIDLVFDWLNAGLVTYVDPVVCAVLAGHEDVYDCPPYQYPAPEPWPPGVPPLPGGEPPGASGAGYNTGDAGFLLLSRPDDPTVAAACLYATDRVTDTIAVAGAATTGDVRCVLTDTATGTVLYDETAPAQHATIPANDGPVTVCTAGPVDLRCRPGEPLGRRS